MGVLFPTSVVGSLPRPQFVRDLLNEESDVPVVERDRLLDQAVAGVVAMQESAGLDMVTDGEWRRLSYIGVIAELAHGFARGRNPQDGRPWTTVVDRITATEAGFVAREAQFLRSITQRQIKVTLPAPALLGERMWDAERSAKAYPDRDEFVRDLVPVLRGEIGRLEEIGVDMVQIDDPHLCLFVDPDVRATYDDPDKAASFAVDMINAVIDGFSRTKFAVHLCRRAGARVRGEHNHAGSLTVIVPQLNRLNAQHLTIEMTTPGQDEASVLAGIDDRVEIGVGCVSVVPGEVDAPATIVERVVRVLQHVASDRITLNPDCGFAPGSAAQVDLDEVYLKLCNQTRAAEMLRELY